MIWPFRRKSARTFNEVIERLDGDSPGNTDSGYTVSLGRSLEQVTVYACVRILSESVAQLPMRMYERDGVKRKEVTEHDAILLLNNPNEWQTSHEWWQQIQTNVELQGQGYSFKVRDGTGAVTKLLPLTATQCSVRQDPDWKLKYTVGSEQISGEKTSKEIFHARNISYNGYRGLSTIQLHREEIGLAQQERKHAAVLFRNGTQINKYLQLTEAGLGQAAWDQLKDQMKKWKGVNRAHEVPVVPAGAEMKSMLMSNDDAQFLESRQLSEQQLSSIYGVPLFLLNSTEKSTTWGTGLEQLSRGYLRFTLAPRLNRLQQTCSREFLTPEERQRFFFEFDTTRFTMGDLKEQMDAYRTAIEAGIYNPDECRGPLGSNPREDGKGDEYIRPANMIGVSDNDDAAQSSTVSD
jgi:HK97 family phage portal protein